MKAGEGLGHKKFLSFIVVWLQIIECVVAGLTRNPLANRLRVKPAVTRMIYQNDCKMLKKLVTNQIHNQMNHQLFLLRVGLRNQQRNRRQRIVIDFQLAIGF